MKSDFHKELELQKEFDKSTITPKIMIEHYCNNCKGISRNLEIHKYTFDKKIYDKIEELQKIVDENNKEIQNKIDTSFMGKSWIYASLHLAKLLISYNEKYGWIYIRCVGNERNIEDITNDMNKIKFYGFRKCYVTCPFCNHKYLFKFGD